MRLVCEHVKEGDLGDARVAWAACGLVLKLARGAAASGAAATVPAAVPVVETCAYAWGGLGNPSDHDSSAATVAPPGLGSSSADAEELLVTALRLHGQHLRCLQPAPQRRQR